MVILVPQEATAGHHIQWTCTVHRYHYLNVYTYYGWQWVSSLLGHCLKMKMMMKFLMVLVMIDHGWWWSMMMINDDDNDDDEAFNGGGDDDWWWWL